VITAVRDGASRGFMLGSEAGIVHHDGIGAAVFWESEPGMRIEDWRSRCMKIGEGRGRRRLEAAWLEMCT